MRLSNLIAVFALLLPFAASADWRGEEIRERPGMCHGYPNQGFNQNMGRTMEEMIVRIRCRDLRGGLRAVKLMERQILREIERVSGGTEYGECYFERGCVDRASQTTPTKDMCLAAGGKSWKRTDPTPGKCQNI